MIHACSPSLRFLPSQKREEKRKGREEAIERERLFVLLCLALRLLLLFATFSIKGCETGESLALFAEGGREELKEVPGALFVFIVQQCRG